MTSQPDQFPWDDPSAVVTVEMHGEPVSKARARIRVLGGKVSSYTPSGTVLAQRAVSDAFEKAGFTPTDAWDFALSIEFRLGSWQRRDVDNLAKLVLDAATGIVWVDDVQVRRLVSSVDRGSENPGTTVRLSLLPPQRRPTSPCGWCGKPVPTYPSWGGSVRYCDATCRSAASAERRARRCDVCGSEFIPESRRPRVTCSEACFLVIQERRAGRPRATGGTPTQERAREAGRRSKAKTRAERKAAKLQSRLGL